MPATPDAWNTLLADIAAALSLCVLRDGQGAAIGNLSMGGYRITNVGNGTALTDAPNLGQIQNGAGVYAAAGGTADAITLAPLPAPTAYQVGQLWRMRSRLD